MSRHPLKPTSTTFCDQSRSKRRPGATTWRFGLPQGRPRGPQGPPRAAKAIFASPLGFDPLGDRLDAGWIWPWDFCYIFIQKCGFRVGGVAKTKIRQTLRFAPPPRELRSQPACNACRHCQRHVACASPCKGRIRHAWRDKRAADSDWRSQ